ncbi:Kelch repeat-containing protein [Petrimonas sp.]|uniref:Kelch repeat-containing protein n=1 Tax=Petrimonas sp. TaxID=2023866 RepID=UPI002FC82AD5
MKAIEKQKFDSKPNNNKNIMTKTFSCNVTSGVPLPKENDRGGHIGGVVEQKIIVSGGNRWSDNKTQKFFLNNTLIFDDQKWIEGPSLPNPIAYSVFAYDESGLYVAGGTSDGISMLKSVYVLRSTNGNAKWERLPDLPEALGFGAGTILNGKFYISGGKLNSGQKTNRMWVLDTNNTNKGWLENNSFSGSARTLHSMVECGNFLYLLGGVAEESPLNPLSDAYKYDPITNKWEKLNDLPLKGYAWVSQPVDDKNILITGRADGSIHSDIWIINSKTMNMKKLGNLIIPSTTAPLVKVSDSQYWLLGGEPDSNKNRTGIVSIINFNK